MSNYDTKDNFLLDVYINMAVTETLARDLFRAGGITEGQRDCIIYHVEKVRELITEELGASLFLSGG